MFAAIDASLTPRVARTGALRLLRVSAQKLAPRVTSDNSATGEPLIIVDGVVVGRGAPLRGGVDPKDIESVEVVKGAAAAYLYGERATAGVIMIRTRGPGGR